MKGGVGGTEGFQVDDHSDGVVAVSALNQAVGGLDVAGGADRQEVVAAHDGPKALHLCLLGDALTKQYDIWAQKLPAGGAGTCRSPWIVEGRKIATAAAASQHRTVQFNHSGGAGFLMQTVDILGHDADVASGFALHFSQKEMGSIWLGLVNVLAQVTVDLPDALGLIDQIRRESVYLGLRIIGPPTAGTAKGPNPRGDRNARAAKHH